MEDHGAGAVVLFSLFEESITQERARLAAAHQSVAGSRKDLPNSGVKVGAEEYLAHIMAAKEAVDIPIIASLNGVTFDGWADYSRLMEQAGADAIELNLFWVAVDAAQSGSEVEQRYLDILENVRQAVRIPIALKLSPFFSSFANMAKRFDEKGADALVLFNRFYQPDVDLRTLTLLRSLGPSSSCEVRLPLLWIAVLHEQLKCDLVGGRGVRSAADVVKYLLTGATAVATASALLEDGIEQLAVIVEKTAELIDSYGHGRVSTLRGLLSRSAVADPGVFERANYIEMLDA